MAKTLRVFQLAKELGVSSKAVVSKCQAEQLPGITNHMSTVKVGLAETIRQWFGEEAGSISSTAVEVAEKVDLTKERKARRRSPLSEESPEVEAPPTIVEEPKPHTSPMPPAETVLAEAKAEPGPAASHVHEPQEQTITDEPTVAAEAPPSLAEPVAEAPPQAPTVTERDGPVGVPNVPMRPKHIMPVGEQLEKPRGAQLKGPNLVRIDQADHLKAPIKAPRTRRQPPAKAAEPEDPMRPQPPDTTRPRGPVRSRGPASDAESPTAAPGRPPGKRRLLNTRRGRSADALPTGPTKFSQADMEELDARLRGSTGFIKQHRRDMRKREQLGTTATTPALVGGKVEIEEPITIKALSAATGIKSADILKYLFNKGVMATINSAIDSEAAMEVTLEYDIELDVKEQNTALELLEAQVEQRERVEVRMRPPVVTVLGHVDHGKTSLLDRIRKADVTTHEFGGITQHIGAHRVTIHSTDGQAKTVVFLDTPGHEAFTSMRSRGTRITDLVVLVVAADDGVMPQTVESINHARAAAVPIMVALNKIDRPEATEENIRRIFGQLAEHGLNPVEWGGDTEVIKTSATDGQGINDLLETLDYQAELLELNADYGGSARGTVIEAEMQRGRGSVAQVLVQEGKLCVGDFIVIGRAFGRVRDMTDDRGNSIREAGPATPVELSGINQIPDAGDKFYVTDSLQKAEQVAMQYRDHERYQQLASKTKVTLDNFTAQLKAGQVKELRTVLKADVQGSVDVLSKSLEEIGTDEVAVRVLHAAVGGITESDVLLADASDAVIIGFHVVAPPAVREIAEAREVDIRLYRVIYDITDDVRKALEGMLEPEQKEQELGSAEVRQVFKVTKVGSIAGCLVTKGMMRRGVKARLVREGVVVTENRDLDSLRRIKDDVREVQAGTECGIKIAGFGDIKPGDVIVCYNVIEVKRTLE